MRKTAIALVAFLLWVAWIPPAVAQTPPEGDLPPLVLPPMPEEGAEGAPSEPAPAEIPPPPEPLPLPEGPAVVRPDLPIDGPRYFALKVGGELVGYSRFEVVRAITLGGRTEYVLESESRIKIGVGEVQDYRFRSRLHVNRENLTPTLFICNQESASGDYQVKCIYAESMVAQTNRVGEVEQTHVHDYQGAPPRLLFNNLWGHLDTFAEHYWLLVRSAVEGGVLPAYDPILRGGGEITVYEPIEEPFEWAGKTIPTRVYPVTDLQGTLLGRVRVRADNLEVLSIAETGNGLTFIRTGPEVAARVEEVAGYDLWKRKAHPSNVYFPDPEKLTTLEAEVELHLRGGQFAHHRIPGYRQYFTGEMRQGYMKGTVTVRSVPIEVRRRTPFPLPLEELEEVQAYLQAGPGIESDDPALANKAMELTWKSENSFEAGRRLNSFVASTVEEGPSLPSARFALETGRGNSESRALLLVALARAAGVPARRVGGVVFQEGFFVPHHWAELWLGREEGWTPFDPTTVEAGHLGATHIALWESGEVQSLDIRVTDFAPRPPGRVAFFNHELTWPVGEERVYAIMSGGKRVGREVARVKDLILVEDQEVYRFEAEARLDGEEKSFHATSELLLEPTGLPVRFSLRADPQEGPSRRIDYSFTRNTVREEITSADGETLVREVPYSRGTYLTDQRFLSQWALVVGQLPRPEETSQELDATSPRQGYEPGQRFTFHVFVPEDLRTREMVLEAGEEEPVTLADGTEIPARRFQTDQGMAFYLDERNQVVKIAIPQQELELVLEHSDFHLDLGGAPEEAGPAEGGR